MRPYSRCQKLNVTKKIFNYRLSRVRRVVKSSFGILTARWQIYRKPIIASINASRRIVQATCCLHNFVINHEHGNQHYSTLTTADGTYTKAFQNYIDEKHSFCKTAATIRNTFADYFEGDGAIA